MNIKVNNQLIKRSVMKGIIVVLFLITAIIWYYTIRYRVVRSQNQYNILTQRYSNLATETELQTKRSWLSSRWNTPSENIHLILEDSEPWMRVLGLLDVQTLSSAKIWIIDSNYQEGRDWISILTKWNTPHLGQIYLESEYRPSSQPEKEIAIEFYSTPTYWRENWLGNLAVITGLRWTEPENKTGEIYAYQAEKFLPSITIPFENGVVKKWHTSQTPQVLYRGY